MTGVAKDWPPRAMERREATPDGMLFSPSAARNAGSIAEAFSSLLPPRCRVLELGAGTGEHGERLCRLRPDLRWTPSDPDLAARRSCAARAAGVAGMAAPLALDLTAPDWWRGAPECDAVFCANTIHIAPWAAAEGLAAGAARLLPPSGLLALYGPFLEGAESAPSNLAFSRDLRARDARWGVRERADVEALLASVGFDPAQRIAMPANNSMLVFRRR